MRRYFFLLFLIPNIYLNLSAQNIDTIKGYFLIHSHKLPYTLLKIGQATNSETKIPLILFLHGAGERGDKNIEQLTVGLPVLINTIMTTKTFPCIIVVPQCPANQKWVNTDWTKTSHLMEMNMAWPLQATVQLLDSIIRKESLVDSNSIYLTGISMGGFGTWELLQRFPKKYAAAIPICGGGDTTLASSLIYTPIWAFHGRKDKLVKVSRTTDMITAINKKKKTAKSTILENEGHLCWNTAYKNITAINWLFLQRLYAK